MRIVTCPICKETIRGNKEDKYVCISCGITFDVHHLSDEMFPSSFAWHEVHKHQPTKNPKKTFFKRLLLRVTNADHLRKDH